MLAFLLGNIMSTIPTQNPVPSEAAKDLKFNSGKIDEFVTSMKNKYIDRFGQEHFTIEGLRWVAQQAISQFGYITLDSFQKGAEITLPNQVLRDEVTGEYYRWDGELPKSVQDGSTPDGSGGVGIGKWLSVGDASLRSELSSITGASLVGTDNGNNVQTEINELSNKTNYIYDLVDFVKITDYKDLSEGDDWTNAIQAALDSGKPVYGRGTYKVSGKLKSKGQKLIGNWFINATHLHYTFNKIPATVELTEKNHIRTIYTDMAYDLCELLAMKSLGFNIISHYCNFNAHDSGRGGSVDILLDNALSAGMYVALNTETAINSINLNITLGEYISKYDGHPSVWGYSVYDEPATRKISVADQDDKIEKLRKLTSKPLTCVDLVVETCPPFFENWSKNYDVFFVDSYAQHYEIDKISDMFALDCEKHRLDFGGVKAMSGCLKLVPVVGLFTSTEGQYSRNNQQIINSAKFFGTKGGGDYGAFVWGSPWDSTSDDRIQNSEDFQAVCVELSNQPITGVLPETNCYIFGGFPNYHDYGLSQVLNVLPVKDPNNITPSPWSDSFPTNNRVGDLIYSGIGFKAASSIFQTSIEVKKYVSVYFDCFHMNGMNENTTLQLQLYKGGDLTRNATDKMNIKNKPTFYTSNKWTPATHGENLLLSIENNKVTNKYELLIRGLIVCTSW